MPLHKYVTGPPSVSVEFRHSDAVVCFQIVLSDGGVTIGERLWKIVNKRCNHEKTLKKKTKISARFFERRTDSRVDFFGVCYVSLDDKNTIH